MYFGHIVYETYVPYGQMKRLELLCVKSFLQTLLRQWQVFHNFGCVCVSSEIMNS